MSSLAGLNPRAHLHRSPDQPVNNTVRKTHGAHEWAARQPERQEEQPADDAEDGDHEEDRE